MENHEKREYDPKTLRRLQLTELSILKDFIAICNKHDIPYFMLGGCCIGAFRHGGFIPWDDDIDVCMLREDYNRFLAIAPQEIAGKYQILDPSNTPNLPSMFGKFYKIGTLCQDKEFLEAGVPLGINIDIFPFDRTVSDPALRKKQTRKAWLYAKLKLICFLKSPHIPVDGWKGRFLSAVCRFLHLCFHPFRTFPIFLTKKYLDAGQMFSDRQTDSIIDLTYIRPEDATMRLDAVFPTVSIPFEDITIQVPNQADTILRQYYGDYMQLPPEDKRKNHCPEVLDFGDAE